MSLRTNANGDTSHKEKSQLSMEDLENRNNSTDSQVQDTDPDSTKTTQNPRKSAEVKVVDSSDDTEDEAPDISCGIGSLRTSVFGHRFANLYVFALCFGLSNFFTSMVDQVITVQLTSLERQFNIDNVRAGLFQTASRIGFISTVLFAGHFTKKSHIPLIIGACGVIQGLFLVIPAVMQRIEPFELPILPPAKHGNSSGSSDKGDNAKYLCNTLINGTSSTTNDSSTPAEIKQTQFIVVLVVQAVKGVTDTFHSGFLPTLYMDDNLIDKSKMGVFLGIWQVITELSGPIGKQINGILTKVPIDLKDTEMDPGDKRFVSAWWLAFLVFGLGTSLFSVPIMLFPKKLISQRQRQEALDKAVLTFAGGEVQDEVAGDDDDLAIEHPPMSKTVSSLPDDAIELSESKGRHYSVNKQFSSRNNSRKSSRRRRESGESRASGSRRPSLFPPVVGPTERRVSIAGDLVFEQPTKEGPAKNEGLLDMLKDFPKALVRVLSKPVFVLLLVDVAIISVPLSGTSIFRNAYMANEYNVPMSDVALVSGITTAIGHIVGTLASSWISSKVKTKMGYMYIISGTYFLTLTIIPFYFIIGCSNQPVYGPPDQFVQPVNASQCDCDPNRQLIACGQDDRNYFSPCYAGCADVNGKTFVDCVGINSTDGNSATPGLCDTDCRTNFIIYSVLHGIQSLISAMAMIPRRLLILRIVDPRDRGFATSLFMFCFVFMAIPSPNLFGKVIDDTCLVWDGSVCSLYDRDKIRYLMSGIDIGVHGCVQITFLLMMCIFKWEERKAKRLADKGAPESKVEAATIS